MKVNRKENKQKQKLPANFHTIFTKKNPIEKENTTKENKLKEKFLANNKTTKVFNVENEL